jgi:2'-5' RNA ligase
VPRYVAVLPLEPLEVGDGFSVTAWPLHVTVVQNFTTDRSPEDVGAALQQAISSAAPILATVGEDALFGAGANVRVALVVPTPALDHLHRALHARIAALGARFDDPQFAGDGYRPHVTVTKRARAMAGDILLLSSIALVDMQPVGERSRRLVVWSGALGE